LGPLGIGLSAGVPAATAAAGYWGVALSVTAPARPLLRNRVLYSVKTDHPTVGLTFDDGPDPEFAPRFVEALGGAPATFFVLGRAVSRSPDVVRAVAAAGHEIACHGDTHRGLASIPPRATRRALIRARDTIAEVVGVAPRFYRPAYGVFNAAGWLAAPALGMRRTLWSTWARDWEASATPELIAERTLRGAKPGAILLLHDADGSPGAPSRTLAAIPRILDGLRERGLTCATLSQLVSLGNSP